ncbi:MAG: IS110 family transposase [Bacteroidales bacterium]|nr:IS110 family transposase [Bacteroidales bacterium]
MKNSFNSLTFFIGIDVSKLTLDVTVLSPKSSTKKYKQISNTVEGLKVLNSWLRKIDGFKYSHALFCLEHTGIYTRVVLNYLSDKSANIWLESSLYIKKSLGLTRGKNDKIDSLKIAEYAYRFIDKAELYQNNLPVITELKDLLTCRARLKKQLKINRVAINELIKADPVQGEKIELLSMATVRGIELSVKEVEKEIMDIVEQNKKLKEVYDLATSIPGVGPILTLKLMVYTKMFTKFKNNRQLACYCGVAPFEHSSGTSVRGKTGVSKFANSDLKSTLHMAAISSVQHNPDLKVYYERKVKEGKNKMSAINAVRNKLLYRIVAVVNRKTPYVNVYNV